MPRLPGSHRQLLLFFGAVLAPAILLVASAVREQRRGEVLARQMAAESRAQSARQIANQLRLTLEQIRLDATAGTARADSTAAALLIARPLDDRRAQRAGSSGPGQRSPTIAAQLRRAEAAEFAGRSGEAIERYSALLRRAQDPALVGTARLGLARTLARAGRTDEAAAHYRALVAVPFELQDDEGIPLALYAADRLKDAPQHQQAVIARLRERSTATHVGRAGGQLFLM